MGTKSNPGKFDCYANALPDEPIFILLGRDRASAAVVRTWASMRENAIAAGHRPAADMEQVDEARKIAKQMDAFAERYAVEKKPRRFWMVSDELGRFISVEETRGEPFTSTDESVQAIELVAINSFKALEPAVGTGITAMPPKFKNGDHVVFKKPPAGLDDCIRVVQGIENNSISVSGVNGWWCADLFRFAEHAIPARPEIEKRRAGDWVVFERYHGMIPPRKEYDEATVYGLLPGAIYQIKEIVSNGTETSYILSRQPDAKDIAWPSSMFRDPASR